VSAVLGWKRDPAWTTVLLASFAVLGLFLVWPLVTTLAYGLRGSDGSYGLSGYAAFFKSRAYRDTLWNTLILGGAVTATSMAIGGALAVLVARCRFRFAGWVAALPLVTLVIPMSSSPPRGRSSSASRASSTAGSSRPVGRSGRCTRGGDSSSS
jgi:ABC-type Fe3+ transport system permease subunit